MSDRDVLTQEEIDALISGVNDTDADPSSEPTPELVITPYDLANAPGANQGRLPGLEVIGEKFTRSFAEEFSKRFRFGIELGSGGISIMSYQAFAKEAVPPCNLCVVRATPLQGLALISFDAVLVFALVEQFFGGESSTDTSTPRSGGFSVTENRVIDRVLDIAFASLSAAWQDVLAISFQLVGREFNPSLLGLYQSDETLVVQSFPIAVNGRSGQMSICLPLAALEPYQSLLDATARVEEEPTDESWRPLLEKALMDAPVSIHCEVARSQLRLADVLRLRVGDVLPVEMPAAHLVCVGEQPLFHGKLGDAKGKLALEYLQPHLTT